MKKLLIFAIIIAVVLVFLFRLKNKIEQKASTSPEIISDEEFCSKVGSFKKLSYDEAVKIAQDSECVSEGRLTTDHFCNTSSGTWWIDLEIDKPGCSPACVIDTVNKTAEINWRCTGLIQPDDN